MLPRWLKNAEALTPIHTSKNVSVSLAPITAEIWDQFVAICPDALLFHNSAWLNFLTSLYEMRWEPLGVWSEDKLVGLFPLLTRQLGPFRLAGSPLMQVIASTPFMGPVIPLAQLPATLVALEPILRHQRIDHIELAFPFLLEDLPASVSLGYSIEVCHTVLLQLAGKTPEQLWHGLSPSCRRAVRKAQASDLQIIEAHDSHFLDIYYPMCEEVYRGAGRPPHLSKEFYLALWQTFAKSENLKVLLATQRDTVLAGGIFLLYGETAYYLSGASFDSGLGLRPNNLLQWHFIEWAAIAGYKVYDLGGAGHPGITRFKLGFGGELSVYTRLYRANSVLARLGRMAYKEAIPLWRKLLTKKPGALLT